MVVEQADQYLVDQLILKVGKVLDRHPRFGIWLLHESLRLTYPVDPYVSDDDRSDEEDQLDFVRRKFSQLIQIAGHVASFGYYQTSEAEHLEDCSTDVEGHDVRIKTGDVYDVAWSENDSRAMVEEAQNIIRERWEKNDISLDLIKDRCVLDLGCGSGRYSVALKCLGAKTVTAVDFGDWGLSKGRSLAEQIGVDVVFKKADILDLPFRSGCFDFVFCNGVTHHSTNMTVATHELFRVLKKGGSAWYYVYGNHGLQWYLIKSMNQLFKKKTIKKTFVRDTLLMLGMPENRHIFIDHWFVPILQLTSKADFEKLLSDAGFSFRRCIFGRSTDADFLAERGSVNDKLMYGDAELRYLVTK